MVEVATIVAEVEVSSLEVASSAEVVFKEEVEDEAEVPRSVAAVFVPLRDSAVKLEKP